MLCVSACMDEAIVIVAAAAAGFTSKYICMILPPPLADAYFAFNDGGLVFK